MRSNTGLITTFALRACHVDGAIDIKKRDDVIVILLTCQQDDCRSSRAGDLRKFEIKLCSWAIDVEIVSTGKSSLSNILSKGRNVQPHNLESHGIAGDPLVWLPVAHEMFAFCASHLHIRSGDQIARLSKLRIAPRQRFANLATMKVDAHVHIWDPQFPTHPDHPLPPIPGGRTDLIKNMDVAGIEKAIVVQPINYMFDHTYVQEAVRAFPTRLFGVGLANTKGSPEVACGEMDVLVQNGFRGFRINPNFTGDTFRHESVLAVLKRASELDVPVALFAKPKHVPELEYLMQSCPNVKIILDHFSFATPDDRSSQEAVIDVVRRHSNVFVKTSAWFRVSKAEWPHDDLHSFLDDLIRTAGPERLLWGSDYPFVKEQYEYSKAFSLIASAVQNEDRVWIQGQTAQQLYKL